MFAPLALVLRYISPTGHFWAQDLGDPEPKVARVPDATVESFASVANIGNA